MTKSALEEQIKRLEEIKSNSQSECEITKVNQRLSTLYQLYRETHGKPYLDKDNLSDVGAWRE